MQHAAQLSVPTQTGKVKPNWGKLKIAWFWFVKVLDFVFNGHIVIFLIQWIIRVNGYIAEGSMLLAVLWISSAYVAPNLIELFMTAQSMQYVVSFALTVLALVPEIMLINAITNVVSHWIDVKWECSAPNIIQWVW